MLACSGRLGRKRATCRPYRAASGAAVMPCATTLSTTVSVTDREHPVGVGGIEAVESDEREHDRSEAARAEPTDERHRCRSSPAPVSEIATGTMRTTVSASTAKTTSCHTRSWNAGTMNRRPEQEPHEQREQLTDVVSEADELVVTVGRQGAEGEAADKGTDEAVPARLMASAYANEREAEHGELPERGCAPSPSAGRVAAAPPRRAQRRHRHLHPRGDRSPPLRPLRHGRPRRRRRPR